MSFRIVLSIDAINDIDRAVDYYNALSAGLGFEFTNTIGLYFNKIASLPTTSAIRYDDVRAKPIIHFHLLSVSL